MTPPYISDPARRLVEQVRSETPAASALADLRDYHQLTYEHSFRVACVAVDSGFRAGLGYSRSIAEAGLLHDVGKCRVSLAILDKPGTPTRREIEEIRRHPRIMFEMLRGVVSDDVRMIAVQHHEFQPDPYPRSERREESSGYGVEGQLLALADLMCSVTERGRMYREPAAYGELFGILDDFTGDRSLVPFVLPSFSERRDGVPF